MSGAAGQSHHRAGPLFWLTGAALGLVVGLPFLFILLQAVFPGIGAGSFAAPFGALGRVLDDGALPGQTANSLILGLGTAALSAAVAVPLAAARGLFRLPGAAVWDLAFLLPFMIPPYIATLGWIMTLQPGGYLSQLTGIDLGGALFSVPGMVFVMAMTCFPVVYFALSRAFAAVGGRFSDVSRVFGAGPARAFWRVTLPLVTPALAASLLLVFSMAIEEYGTPAILGRRIGFTVLVTGIDGALADWPVDLPQAAVLALMVMALSLLAFQMQRLAQARRDFDTTGGKPQRDARRPLGRWRLPVLAGFALVAFLSAGVPLLAILATALSRTISGGLAPSNLGLQNFAALTDVASDGLDALVTSLWLGLATALAAGVLGTLTGFVVVRSRARGRAAVDLLAALPNAMPGVVIALGLILLWNQPALPVTPYNTMGILVLAYLCILLPQPMRYAAAAFRQIGPSLEAAARVAGARPARVVLRVLLPMILPSVLSAMLLVFAVASRELVASLLIVPVGRQTVATYIWQQFDQGSVGLGMAMAFVAIVISTLLPMAVLALTRRGEVG